MLRLPAGILPNLLSLFLVLCFLFSLSVAPSIGMGMGDIGGGGDVNSCTPDDPLVILPGPIGSPVRITHFDKQTYLVADYSRRQLLWYQPSGDISPFIETLGRPLSVAISKSYNPAGKIKEIYYFVGNDDARSIDIYYEKNDQFFLLGQYPVETEGVQALDMTFDQESNQLFVVDGLAREIKVIQRDGQLIRRFGQGVLDDPKGIVLGSSNDGSKIYVSDYGPPSFSVKASIEVFDKNGNHLKTISNPSRFSRPQGLALRDDSLYLADSLLSQILEINHVTGEVTAALSCKGSSEEHLLLQMDVVLGDAGQSLYVADNRNMRITVLPLTQP